MRAEHHARADITADAAESVYRRAGRLLGLSAPLHSEIDLVNRLEKGFSINVIQALRTRTRSDRRRDLRARGPSQNP